jgi:hypothetical protein
MGHGLNLTIEEQKNIRTAILFLRNKVGGLKPLSKVLGFEARTLMNVTMGRATSPTMAFRIARFAKVGVDDVLTGRFPAPGTCPYCGHVPAKGDDERER